MILRSNRQMLELLQRSAHVAVAEEHCGQAGRLARDAVGIDAPRGVGLRHALERLLLPRRAASSPPTAYGAEDAHALLWPIAYHRMSAEAAREVEYRRSNRQIFLACFHPCSSASLRLGSRCFADTPGL